MGRLVTRTAKIVGVSEVRLSDGRLVREHASRVTNVEAVEETESLANNLVIMRAVERAGWTAFVYGCVEITFDTGRVLTLRCERTAEPTLAEQLAEETP